MRHRLAKLCGLCVMTLLASPPGYGAEQGPELPRSALVRRGREATGFLELGPGRSATAFCVHPSGLFITSSHAFENLFGDGEIRIVLDSGTRQQKILKAKVVRRDREADLALLRVEPDGKYQALSLGSSDTLEELMDVVVFGFPFGRVGGAADQFPSISINQGTITSLRRQDDQVHRIQMNAAVNPGNSGGPLLDTRGKVVGAVLGRVEGNVGAGIDLAVPVNVIDRFLAKPEITLQASPSGAVKPNAPVDFSASVISVVPPSTPYALELRLGAGTPGERRIPMTPTGKRYTARAVPFPASTDPLPVNVVVTFADGSVTGQALDGSIGIGTDSMGLGRLSRVRFGAKPQVIAADGRSLRGAPEAPKELNIRVGGQTIRLDSSKATGIEMPDAGSSGTLSCALVTLRGDVEVGRIAVPIYQEGVARPSFEAIRDGRFIRPPRSTSPITYLRVESSPGDYIGGGKSYSYEKDDLTLRPWPNGIQCQVGSNGNWTILFGAGQGRNMEAAEYVGAKRHPFSGDSPGPEFTGNGRGCNTIEGAFRIWEIETRGNTVVRLAVDFVQRCEEKGKPLVGMLRYNSTFH